MSVKLQIQLEHLEQKIGDLTARLHQGEKWKRHLELWLLDQLGMKFPEHLSMSEKTKPSQSSLSTSSNDNFGDTLKENDENQCNSNMTKIKRCITPETKAYQTKRRISTNMYVDKHTTIPVTTTSGEGTTTTSTKEPISQNEAESDKEQEHPSVTTTVSYSTMAPAEIVHSPDHEIDIKYEPIEIEQVPADVIITEEPEISKQEENNVLHILKIDTDGEPTVLNYSQSLPIVQIENFQSGNNNNNSSTNMETVFSGAAIGEETTIGILNADGTITPCRPNVIISSGNLSFAEGLEKIKVLPSTENLTTITTSIPTLTTTSSTSMKTIVTTNDQVDPKGTFVCSICHNKFQGLYLFRQHEKKSECRRLTRIAKLNKSKNYETPGSSTQQQQDKPLALSSKSPVTVPAYVSTTVSDNLPGLKYKCEICKSNYASSAYLKFHLSKVHGVYFGQATSKYAKSKSNL